MTTSASDMSTITDYWAYHLNALLSTMSNFCITVKYITLHYKIKNVYSIQCALIETCKEFFCEMANTLTEMKGKACDAFSSGSNFSHLK